MHHLEFLRDLYQQREEGDLDGIDNTFFEPSLPELIGVANVLLKVGHALCYASASGWPVWGGGGSHLSEMGLILPRDRTCSPLASGEGHGY